MNKNIITALLAMFFAANIACGQSLQRGAQITLADGSVIVTVDNPANHLLSAGSVSLTVLQCNTL